LERSKKKPPRVLIVRSASRLNNGNAQGSCNPVCWYPSSPQSLLQHQVYPQLCRVHRTRLCHSRHLCHRNLNLDLNQRRPRLRNPKPAKSRFSRSSNVREDDCASCSIVNHIQLFDWCVFFIAVSCRVFPRCYEDALSRKYRSLSTCYNVCRKRDNTITSR
jgi:hypothetical protein